MIVFSEEQASVRCGTADCRLLSMKKPSNGIHHSYVLVDSFL